MMKKSAKTKSSARSYGQIGPDDLRRLAELAQADLKDFFSRCPQYKNQPLLLCLCQGAAEHYVRQKHGVKDFDVWVFFPKRPDREDFPPRRPRKGIDFGTSRFGRHPSNKNHIGRQVDIMGRSIPRKKGQSPEDCVRDWLQHGGGRSPSEIATRPIVVVYPESKRGTVIWDPKNKNGH